MSFLKENIISLNDYVVEQDLTRIKLNQNESPFDIPTFLKKQILERMRLISWNRYPSGNTQALIEGIAEYNDFPASGIIAGNGSNELIQTLVYSTCDTNHSVVTIQPGFSVYKRVAEIMNIEVIEVPLFDDFSFDIHALIEAGQSASIMFLTTPNNPTGTTLHMKQIQQIVENVPCVVAIDEAYHEFSKETALPLIPQYEKLVILRTFSKALLLAGMRLGYILGPEELMRGLRKARLPFSVGIFQQVAGEAMLKHKCEILDYADQVNRERERMFGELQGMEGIQPSPSLANFILFETRGIGASELFEELFKRGVLIRYFGGKRLENMLRVTVGNPEENDTFLCILRDVLRRREDESSAL